MTPADRLAANLRDVLARPGAREYLGSLLYDDAQEALSAYEASRKRQDPLDEALNMGDGSYKP